MIINSGFINEIEIFRTSDGRQLLILKISLYLLNFYFIDKLGLWGYNK